MRIFLHLLGKVENIIKSDKSITRRKLTQGKLHAICIVIVKMYFASKSSF